MWKLSQDDCSSVWVKPNQPEVKHLLLLFGILSNPLLLKLLLYQLCSHTRRMPLYFPVLVTSAQLRCSSFRPLISDEPSSLYSSQKLLTIPAQMAAEWEHIYKVQGMESHRAFHFYPGQGFFSWVSLSLCSQRSISHLQSIISFKENPCVHDPVPTNMYKWRLGKEKGLQGGCFVKGLVWSLSFKVKVCQEESWEAVGSGDHGSRVWVQEQAGRTCQM